MVGCTQPRRVAAMSVARRVADEMDVEVEYQSPPNFYKRYLLVIETRKSNGLVLWYNV